MSGSSPPSIRSWSSSPLILGFKADQFGKVVLAAIMALGRLDPADLARHGRRPAVDRAGVARGAARSSRSAPARRAVGRRLGYGRRALELVARVEPKGKGLTRRPGPPKARATRPLTGAARGRRRRRRRWSAAGVVGAVTVPASRARSGSVRRAGRAHVAARVAAVVEQEGQKTEGDHQTADQVGAGSSSRFGGPRPFGS